MACRSRVLLPVALFLAAASHAAAQATPAAGSERLEGFSTTDLALLEPYLQTGPVALVEFTVGESLPAITLATRVNAPAAELAATIGQPAAYGSFMPAIDDVQIEATRGNSTAFLWTWTAGIFTLSGHNVLTMSAPPAGHPERGYRAELRNARGDLGTGRLVWRIYPRGDRQCVAVLSGRLDLRDGSYVARELSTRGRSVQRTVNIALTTAILLDTKAEAERRAAAQGTTAAQTTPPAIPPQLTLRPARARARARLSTRRLAPLLERGDLVVLKLDGTGVPELSLLGRMGVPADRVRRAMADPAGFGTMLVPGSYARVVETTAEGVATFDWGIDVPLIGTSGRMTLAPTRTGADVRAVSGALAGGEWQFETRAFRGGEAAVFGHARFDPSSSSWLVRAVVAESRSFGPGIAIGSEVMLLRALRARASELQ